MAKTIEVGDGRTLTAEEFVSEFGEEWRDWAESTIAPTAAESDMTEGERYLADKMQSEHEVNAAAADAGVESIFDLPSEDDDEEWTPPDDWPESQDYDYEGALRDLEARGT